MRFPAFFGEFDLLLSFGKAGAAGVIETVMAVRARNAFNIKR
jgi:hypothetical protein